MNAIHPIFNADLTRLAARADDEREVYHRASNTEAMAYFQHDWFGQHETCRAVLIGLVLGDEFPEVLTRDDAVNRFGLVAVREWETESADAAMEDL